MEAENVVLQRAQRVAAYQAEIGDVLFHFAAVRQSVILAIAEFQTHPAQVPVPVGAVSKAQVANAKYGPKDAVAGYLPVVTSWTQSITMAVRTGRLCERYRL